MAQIVTFGTMAARGSVRDVGRVLGMPYGDVDAVAKLIPSGPGALHITLEAVSYTHLDVYKRQLLVWMSYNLVVLVILIAAAAIGGWAGLRKYKKWKTEQSEKQEP